VGFVRLVDQLIAYEEGQITQDEEVAFFKHLVETGVCWQLSGHIHPSSFVSVVCPLKRRKQDSVSR
jgi:hypothetical protein